MSWKSRAIKAERELKCGMDIVKGLGKITCGNGKRHKIDYDSCIYCEHNYVIVLLKKVLKHLTKEQIKSILKIHHMPRKGIS